MGGKKVQTIEDNLRDPCDSSIQEVLCIDCQPYGNLKSGGERMNIPYVGFKYYY